MYNRQGMKNKILIVDDSAAWVEFHVKLIKELYGKLFDITTADSAAEALNIIKNNSDNPFALIISDMQMELNYLPKLAGEWLVENVKTIKAYEATKIVLISGVYNIEELAKKLEVDCISKNMLVNNKILMKYMFEKLMPFLTKI